jgi:hypothetical protein
MGHAVALLGPERVPGKGPPVRRAVIEIGPFVVVSVLIAAGALIVGGNMTAPPAPVPAYASQRPGCQDAPVVGLDNSGLKGSARLCILDESTRPAVDVDGLTPGMAYVAWFAYFDRPQACQKGQCTIGDLRRDAVGGASGRMDGIVADGVGKAKFNGDFRDFRLSGGSEASVFLFERGIVGTGDTRGRARQLLTLQVPGLDLPETHTGAGGGRLVAQAVFQLP